MSIIGFIVIGDRTSHGGEVISGDPTWTIDGIPVARVGDKVSCPRCERVSTIISSRFPALTDNGVPVAYDQDRTEDCGAVLYSRHNGHAGWDDEDDEDAAAVSSLAIAPVDGMIYASLAETQEKEQETECAHLLRDIQREKENIKKLDRAIKEWKKGQELKDYGLAVDATPEGYRGEEYQTSSKGYKKAVDELEADTTIIDRLSRFDIRDWNPFGNREETVKRWLAAERKRSVSVLNKMEQIYGVGCKQGTEI
jgi:uncharacterized Zn-binding protein involved in type VI secretion